MTNDWDIRLAVIAERMSRMRHRGGEPKGSVSDFALELTFLVTRLAEGDLARKDPDVALEIVCEIAAAAWDCMAVNGARRKPLGVPPEIKKRKKKS